MTVKYFSHIHGGTQDIPDYSIILTDHDTNTILRYMEYRKKGTNNFFEESFSESIPPHQGAKELLLLAQSNGSVPIINEVSEEDVPEDLKQEINRIIKEMVERKL